MLKCGFEILNSLFQSPVLSLNVRDMRKLCALHSHHLFLQLRVLLNQRHVAVLKLPDPLGIRSQVLLGVGELLLEGVF